MVSVEAAAADYGVVVAQLDLRRLVCEVDDDATAALRASMRAAAPAVAAAGG